MPRTLANGIAIEYESLGPAAAPAVLLIMGLGAPLTRWPDEICNALVARGFRVIRFDNRDCGLSQRFDQTFLPDIAKAMQGGAPLAVPYTLADMAADCIGLLAALGIDKAHVAGASMGGAIAQVMAARHPRQVASLTCIMATSGNPLLPPPTPAAAQALFAPLPRDRSRAAIVADAIKRYRAVESPAYPAREEDLKRMFEREYDRGFHPQGVARQLGAILASGDRRPLLRSIAAPTVVLHGEADPLIRPECGRDIARHVPGAEFRSLPGMGHDFPPALAPAFADAIAAAARI